MEDVRVNFETAKLAKEKGFNISCDWKIAPCVKEFLFYQRYPNNSEYTYNPDEDSEAIGYEERYNRLVNQPTQSLLQKWMREKHGIFVEVTTDLNVGILFTYRISKLEKYCVYHHDLKTTFYDSYEQALEEGLQEALKLIK